MKFRNICRVRHYTTPPAIDHRQLGKQLHLFHFNNDASPGSPFFLPHGTRIVSKLTSLLRKQYAKMNIHEVISPIIYNKELWEKSGHWMNYKNDMFLLEKEIKIDDGGGGEEGLVNGLKPMNCPGHCLIYSSTTRSYRDLPLRLAEFSPLHRNEASGALTGLTRVKKFHQDDVHIFCTSQQIKPEIKQTLSLINWLYKDLFKFSKYTLNLSTRPKNETIKEGGILGSVDDYEIAEGILREVLEEEKISNGVDWLVNDGDGAFYGPKIDVCVDDALGRKHQLATIQLDFQLPSRFELTYQAKGETLKQPILIHRAALGSIERIIAILLEHFNGHLPFWLSPRQAIVLSTTPTNHDYAQACKDILGKGEKGDGVRFGGKDMERYFVDVDNGDKTLGKKVRDAMLMRYNYVIVVGDRERMEGTVFLKERGVKEGVSMSVEEVRVLFKKVDEEFR